jgi:hypothetical protein
MALTKISEIGGVIQGNWDDEFIISGYGDGAIKAGMLVSFLATGVVQPVHPDTNNEDEFLGISLGSYDTDIDTAVPATSVINVVIPQSGHLYGVLCTNPGAALAGEPMQIDIDADGLLEAAGDIETEHIARKYKHTSGDSVAIVIWGV